MHDLTRLARRLDTRRIRSPQNLLIKDYAGYTVNFSIKNKKLEQNEPPPVNFMELATRVTTVGLDDTCTEVIDSLMTELSLSQNSNNWNSYIANNGKIIIDEAINSFDKSGSMVTIGKRTDDGQIKLRWEISYNERADGSPNTLNHELGHWIDEESYEALQSGTKRKFDPNGLSGFHSDNSVWKKICELDGELYPDSETKAIGQRLRHIGYYESAPKRENEWQEEFFAEAVGRHNGPAPEDKKQSPLFKGYMQKIVDLDAQIMMQDKPREAKYAYRKKLYDRLREPLRQHFDMEKIDGLLKQYNEAALADSRSTRGKKSLSPLQEGCASAIEKCIDTGLQDIAREVAREIGMNFTGSAQGAGHGRKRS